MYRDDDFKEIVNILPSSIPGTKEIILFGSHARGDAVEGSDADIIAITEKNLDRKEKLRALARAWDALGRKGFRVDIIVKTANDFEIDKQIPVTISHTIMQEGKSLWKTTA